MGYVIDEFDTSYDGGHGKERKNCKNIKSGKENNIRQRITSVYPAAVFALLSWNVWSAQLQLFSEWVGPLCFYRHLFCSRVLCTLWTFTRCRDFLRKRYHGRATSEVL